MSNDRRFGPPRSPQCLEDIGPPRISSRRLTTCQVLPDGDTVRLDFIDQRGAPVSLMLPFEQAEALTMTLPHLLTHATKARMGSDKARYVFPLGTWSIETPEDLRCLILTLRTTDGFEVSFSVPVDAAGTLGWTLTREAHRPDDPDGRQLN